MKCWGSMTVPVGAMGSIFIIDDRVTNRNIFAKLAQSVAPKAHIQVFDDPVAALGAAAVATPDLIITDYKMPQLDGAAFVRRLRMQPACAELPVIVITVYDDRSFRLAALEAGATDFLQSPVDHQEFTTRVRNLLRLGQQQKQIYNRAVGLERKLEDSELSRQALLRDNRDALAQVIDTVPAMVLASDREGRCVLANTALALFLGTTPAALSGHGLDRVLGTERGGRSRTLDRHVFDGGLPLRSFEEEVADADGRTRVLLTTKSPLRNGTGEIVHVLTTSLDITARKEAEQRLQHLAKHDELTDLPNRSLLRERLRREVARGRRGDNAFALHLLDLDHFKGVNDGLGHHVGDLLLQDVAARLLGVVRKTDTVARLSGDEFAILQTRIERPEDAAELARRMVEALLVPFSHEGKQITVSASAGITVHPRDGGGVTELLRNADAAMYKAKAAGKNGFRFFAPDLARSANLGLALDSDLRTALTQGRFVLFFQPQVSLRTGRIVGAEALLRLHSHDRGLLRPRDFLPLAEQNGLIIPINEWVLRQTCRQAGAWIAEGLPRLRISCNVSPVQFRRQDMRHMVRQVLEEADLDPELLELELTEGILFENETEVAATLADLRAFGVKLSIDDFGTGYSSFSYVRNFPVDRVKIDQSFIHNLETNSNDLAIVRAVIALCRSLHISVLAEGVESAAQLERLAVEDCDEAQGYHVGRPLPAKEFAQLLRQKEMFAPPTQRSRARKQQE